MAGVSYPFGRGVRLTVETMTDAAEFASAWLPERPRVTDMKGNPTWRTSRQSALLLPYIEANVTGVMQSLIITDRDLPEADLIAERLGLPTPSYTALNAHVTSGHITYVLKDPVCLTDAARRPPVNLLARIEHGLSTVLQGDPSYSGFITKNPTHPRHATRWSHSTGHTTLYSLRTLAGALADLGALPPAGNARKNVTRSAVGRNVALFDETRQWAYRAIRTHWNAPRDEWAHAVRAHAWTINETRIANDFTTGPLTYKEVTHLAKSITGWVWTRFTPEKFNARQKALAYLTTNQVQASQAATNKRRINRERVIQEANNAS